MAYIQAKKQSKTGRNYLIILRRTYKRERIFIPTNVINTNGDGEQHYILREFYLYFPGFWYDSGNGYG